MRIFSLRRLAALFSLSVFSLVSTPLARAGSATWANPGSGDWYTATNWTPNTIPNGPNDVATFAAAIFPPPVVTIPSSTNTILDSIVFDVDFYSVSVSDQATLTFVGSGLLNNGALNSGLYAALGSTVIFQGTAMDNDSLGVNGVATFRDHSGTTAFLSCFGGLSPGEDGGVVTFADQSSASGILLVQNGIFGGASGKAYFKDDSTADQSELDINRDAIVDISGHNAPGLAVDRLSGSGGRILLGKNNLSATFVETSNGDSAKLSIEDGGQSGGTGGTLTKTGGTDTVLTLSGNSSYTGGTFVEGGSLLIHASVSHTPVGSGDVHVDNGTFGGTGKVKGRVIVGTGTGAPATLVAGGVSNSVRMLNLKGPLSFAANGFFQTGIDADSVRVQGIKAHGVTIAEGAQITVTAKGDSEVPQGTVFTILENTTSRPIAGMFRNLPDGGTLVVGTTTYQADYGGGDGNDLTLTAL